MDTRDLDTITIDGLNGHQLVEYVGDVNQVIAHFEALKLKATHQLAYCPPGDQESPPERTEFPGDRAVGVLEAHCGWTRYWAGHHVALAMDLCDTFTETLKALDAGELDLQSARAISERTGCLKDPLDRRRVESAVLDYIRESNAKGLRRSSWKVRQRTDTEVLKVDPEAAEKRHKKRVEDRGVWLRPGEDSTADLLIHDLPSDQAVQAYARIDRAARHAKSQGDTRNLAQLRADFVASMLEGTGRTVDVDTGQTSTPDLGELGEADRRAGGRIVLTTTPGELAGLTSGASSLGWVGAICSEVARRIAINNLDNPGMEYTVAVTGPRTGKVTQIHPLSRTFIGRLRSMVQVVRPTCDWFTCSKPAMDCEVDHGVDYANGGPTSLDNGRPKCTQHHREKNINGWTDHTDPETGQHVLRSPYGHQYHEEEPPF